MKVTTGLHCAIPKTLVASAPIIRLDDFTSLASTESDSALIEHIPHKPYTSLGNLINTHSRHPSGLNTNAIFTGPNYEEIFVVGCRFPSRTSSSWFVILDSGREYRWLGLRGRGEQEEDEEEGEGEGDAR